MIKVGDTFKATNSYGTVVIQTVERMSKSSVWFDGPYFYGLRIKSIEQMLNGGFDVGDGTVWKMERVDK